MPDSRRGRDGRTAGAESSRLQAFHRAASRTVVPVRQDPTRHPSVGFFIDGLCRQPGCGERRKVPADIGTLAAARIPVDLGSNRGGGTRILKRAVRDVPETIVRDAETAMVLGF